MIENVVKDKLFRLEVLTLNRECFEQIELLAMARTVLDEAQRQAEREGVVIVLLPDENRPDIQEAWLIGQGEHRLWRWMIGDARGIAEHGGELPWLLALPQVFLRGAKGSKKK